MASKQKHPVFTYHTRVQVTPEQDHLLRDYASLFGRVERSLYAELEKGKDARQLKTEYLVRFAITARQFNAVNIQLQGKIQGLREQLPVGIDNLKRRIGKAKKVLAKLAKQLPGSALLHQKRRRLANLEQRLERLRSDQQSGRTHICFGTKKLFRAQFHGPENGWVSHEEWQQRWRAARSSQFFVVGSKDETGGCQGCVAMRTEDGRYRLRVRLPHGAGEEYVVLSGVQFAYGQKRWEESLASHRAVSYRFVRDGKGWRVFVSTEASPVPRITDRRRGAIGIDINSDQLAVAEVDGSGNFVGGEAIACVTYGKRRGQAADLVGVAVKRAMTAAIRVGKPVVVERLEFSKKKAALEGEGSQRARMLTSFAYRRTIQYVKAAAFRAGVEVIEVNPAYTSTMGAINYAARYGISIHEGAAIAIVRRGLGLSERPAQRVAQVPTRDNGHVTWPLPARNRGRHVWSFWLEVSRQIRATLRAYAQLLPQKWGSTPGSLCSQTLCAT